MWRTALSCAAFAAIGGFSAGWLTEGFEVWTAEGARRRAVALVPVPAPPATLRGAGLTGLDLRGVLAHPGTVTLVSFIYTRCPGVCSVLGSSFQQLQTAIEKFTLPGAPQRVQLLSISFDPVHDDVQELHRYAQGWRADPRTWRMAAVPDAAQLQRLLAAWQVVVIADGTAGYEHNAALLVVDDQARLVRIFDDADGAAALAFARSLP